MKKEIKNIAHTGVLSSLLYESFSKSILIGMGEKKTKVPRLGVDIILIFEPCSSFGNKNDRITFVQTVSDTIKYSKSTGGCAYPWTENTSAQFDKRNLNTDGCLGQVIDQQMEYNKDFRYTESRNTQQEPFSTRGKKVDKLITILGKVDAQRSDDEKEILNSLSGFGLKPTDHQNQKISTLLETEPIKYVTYGTQKKFGAWLSSARMSDSPRVNPKSVYVSGTLEGGQSFETAIYYEPSNGGSPQILGAIKWGWSIIKEEVNLMEITFEEKISDGFIQAMKQWNQMKIGQFQIPDFKL